MPSYSLMNPASSLPTATDRPPTMSISSSIIDPLLNLHGIAAYSLVGGLAFAEAAAFVGFVLPGETAVILGGVLAYRHAVSLPVMMVVVVLAAIVGDTVGYEVGKRYGQRVLALSVFDRHRTAIDGARDKLLALGGRAVFLARFSAFLRAVVPGLAGTVNMPYRTIPGLERDRRTAVGHRLHPAGLPGRSQLQEDRVLRRHIQHRRPRRRGYRRGRTGRASPAPNEGRDVSVGPGAVGHAEPVTAEGPTLPTPWA